MITTPSVSIILWKYNDVINKGMKPFEVIIMLILAFLLYIMVAIPEEDVNQPTITVKYKCELALRNPHDIPKHVINDCKKLLKEVDDDE
jgi:hypothetical protein